MKYHGGPFRICSQCDAKNKVNQKKCWNCSKPLGRRHHKHASINSKRSKKQSSLLELIDK